MASASESFPRLLDLHPPQDDLRSDVHAGLAAQAKSLPCKYLYDEYGSKLFEKICELPEYYPTRTEMAILDEHIDEISSSLGSQVELIELGSGSSVKTRWLLDRLDDCVAYVPIDISRTRLMESAVELERLYPTVEILPVCADFTQELEIPRPSRPPSRRVWFFPGSTIGNFGQAEATDLLSAMVRASQPVDQLLLGVDLRKDPELLCRAYNDSAGVTSAFNKNLLRRINTEVGANFDLDAFAHEAIWNELEGRIEMHLRSLLEQTVEVDGQSYGFAEGERLFTEASHKYALDEFEEITAVVGLRRVRVWTDPDALFSVQLFEMG
jgi:L-histidine Nalpha-methyltransferase